MKLEDFLQGHLARVSVGMVPATKLALMQALQRFLEYVGDYPIEAITDADVTRYAMWVRGNYCEPTANMMVEAAERALAEYRAEAELTREDMERLKRHAYDNEWRALLVLVAQYGVRLEDVLRLSTRHLRGQQLHYQCGNTRKWNGVFLSAADATLLKGLVPRGALFKLLRAHDVARLTEDLRTLAMVAGVAGKLRDFRALRKYYVRVAQKEGVHED